MSDCSNIRMEPHDVCLLRAYFFGESKPWVYPLALNGRVIKEFFIGGKRYVPAPDYEESCEVIE